MRHVAADARHLLVHRAVGVVVRAHEDVVGRRPQVRGPMPSHDVEVSADAARGHDDRTRPHNRSVLELDTRDRTLPHSQPLDGRPEPNLQRRSSPRVTLNRSPHGIYERLAAAPREMEAWYGV